MRTAEGGPGLLGRLTALSVRRPRAVLAAAVVLALAALALAAFRLELRTSNLDLIDPDLPEVARFRQVATELGTPNVLAVVLEGGEAEAVAEGVDHLAPLLRALPGVRGVVDRSPLDDDAARVLGMDPYLRSEDGRLAVLFVQPEDPESRADRLLPLVRGVRAALEAARLEPLGVSAGLTGMPAYAIEDRQIIERDITRLSWIGALVVAFLVIFAFGSWRQPLSALFALCWTVAATAGVASLYPGHLTLLSAFFASILLGTGIDFGIHILDRMGEKRTTGLDMKRAAVEAVNELEPALLTGAGTTAGAFFAMQASGFQGFAELGFIAGAGVLLCLGAMVTVLPAQLALIEARGDAVRRWYPRRGSAGVRRFVAVLLALGVLASLAVPAPPFDSDYLNLQPEGSEAVRLERELVARTDYSPLFAVFLVENTEALGDLLWRLADEETVGKVRSLHDFELGGAMLEMTEEQRAAFVTPAGHLAVYAFPAGNVWQPEERDAFLARMRSIDPEVTGMPFLGELMISRSQRALRRTTALAALILCLLVGLSLRRPMAALLAAAPAIATFFAMHALMRVLGIAYNPLDIMALPVVLGLAVDDGVHLVHRFLAEGGNLERTLAGSGRSVLLTSLTTLAAFGCLTFTSHRGLGSFALVLCLGVTCALALSLLLLPEVLHLLRHRLLDDAGTPGRR